MAFLASPVSSVTPSMAHGSTALSMTVVSPVEMGSFSGDKSLFRASRATNVTVSPGQTRTSAAHENRKWVRFGCFRFYQVPPCQNGFVSRIFKFG